jgi:hypothetical protein
MSEATSRLFPTLDYHGFVTIERACLNLPITIPWMPNK